MSDNETNGDRRTFMRIATAAGLVGAAAVASGAGQAVAGLAAEEESGAPSAEDPKAPAGLKATPDLRYPLCYETPVIEGVRALTKSFASLSRRDAKGMADNMHFPFGSFEGIEPVVVKTPEDLLSKPPASMSFNPHPDRGRQGQYHS